jgi:CubicO group peptidase (beta-lactamase class C family)
MSAARMHALVIICLSAAFCRASQAAELAWDDGLERSVPTYLDRAIAQGEAMPRLHSLLVSQHGELLLERYFNGRQPDDLANVKSVSKSILSALVGIAIDQRILDGVEITLNRYFGELSAEVDPGTASITLEDLLTMRSGLRATSNLNYSAWVRSDNWVAAALRQPLEKAPGQDMQYSTGNTHLLSAILTTASGRSTLEFAREALTEPLGFELAPWPRDPQGIYFGGNDMRLTPRQMLAFGELYLNGGRRGERQIVPAQWVEASIQPHSRSPHGEARYYGYGWWICALAGFQVPHAWGHGGQFIMLVPELDLVIVTTSSPTGGEAAHEHANEVYQWLQQIIHLVATAPSAPAADERETVAHLRR